MKKIIFLCMAVALTFACSKKDETPAYGDKASVPTAVAAQEAINAGSSQITVTSPLTADASLLIPKSYPAGKIIIITIPAGAHNLVISESASGSQNYPSLELNVGDANNLTLVTPGMSVTVNGSVTGTLTATTAANTLTIGIEANINNLVVLKGNVRLLGTVKTFGEVAAASKVLYPVATVDELRNRTSVTGYDHIANGGVFLMADLSDIIEGDGPLGGITPSQANQDVFTIGVAPSLESELSWDGFILDGNGHSLSGAAYHNVLAVYANNVTIQNLTVLQTTAQKEAEIEKDGELESAINNGISLYGVTGANLMNVNAHDCGQYGVIVNGAEVTVAGITSSANGWGGIDVDQGSGVAITPKLTLASANMTDERAVVVEVDTAVVTVPTGWTSETIEGVTIYSPPAGK